SENPQPGAAFSYPEMHRHKIFLGLIVISTPAQTPLPSPSNTYKCLKINLCNTPCPCVIILSFSLSPGGDCTETRRGAEHADGRMDQPDHLLRGNAGHRLLCVAQGDLQQRRIHARRARSAACGRRPL